MRLKNFLVFFILTASLVIAVPAMAQEKTLMMSTTTSTQDSGLLEYLQPKFEKDTGIKLKWVSVGTGKALEHGKNCDVDVMLVHAPKAELEMVKRGEALDRRQIMYNDFVLIGPIGDPAQVKGKSIAEALKTLADKKIIFVSRGDESGTHKAEKILWEVAGMKVPDKENWYNQAGQGMMQTIIIAQEKNGYTLADRGTFIKYEANNKGKPPLGILVEGDTPLRNQYSVMRVNPKTCTKTDAELAETFIEWWAAPSTQKAIEDFKLEGKQLFFPNAEKK